MPWASTLTRADTLNILGETPFDGKVRQPMNSRVLKTPAGQCSYAQIVTLFLLALGIGIAALVYISHQRDERTKGESMESVREQLGIEQRMLKDLAKSKNRHFSNEQVALLKRELSPKRGESIAIECPMGDLKSCYLALEINLVFEASGWIVEEFLFAAQGRPGQSLLLLVREESMVPRAESLSRLFSSVGLAVAIQIDSEQLFDLKILVPVKGPKA
jgi:hypothetical protein